MLAAIVEHAALGSIFASTGACLRGQCDHLHHKLMLGAAAILAEAIVMVSLIG
jgi:hypothetical protein